MAEYVEEIFKRYHDTVTSLLEGEEFFSYLMDNIGAGHNKVSFALKKLDKKIDMRWVETLEDCIIPLDTIIRNPRRFIVQEDEIVPIALAKRVTVESVRHLAQHTNLIGKVENDEVSPSQILNVYREESFDIYENRFIYTLLNNLIMFIEKRYNVLFQSIDDEEMVHVMLEGEFTGNVGEQVSYKFDMSSTTKQSYIDMDTKHMGAFARIDRINRIVKEFAASPFAREMKGSAPVRPPIMRTNVIMKDPNFKKALTLWQFIETYHEVGYSIETTNTQQPPEEDSMLAMYSGIALQYIMLKKSAGRAAVMEERKRKPRQLKPKFIKNVVEEIVNDFDISETEIRRIFVEEISRAAAQKGEQQKTVMEAIDRALKLDKEARLRREEAARKERERKKEIERRRIEREKARIAKAKALEKAKKEKAAEKARLAKEKAAQLEKARRAKEKEQERARIAKEKAAEKARLLKEQQREKERLEKQKAAEKAQAARLAAIEKERLEKQKATEKEKAAKAKAAALEKERAAKAKAAEAEKARREKEKEREKARLEKEKAAEKARLQKQKEKEKAAQAKAAAIAKEKAARAKAAAAEKARREKEKEREKARLEKAKAAEKARLQKQKEKAKTAEKPAVKPHDENAE